MAANPTHRTGAESRPCQARRVVLLAFPDVQTLDLTGPLEVFSVATLVLEGEGLPDPGYAMEVVAAEAGPVRASSGLELVAQRAMRNVRGPMDTLLLAGGLGSQRAAQDQATIAWVRRTAPSARRVVSVCTGAYLLAEAGLLAGRRATTHWAYCAQLAADYPDITVAPDPIFVRDGNVYTSAGVTAGMDLALALVEEDLGRDLALAVARWLVLFLKRPGGQAQFSMQLAAQHAERVPIRELQAWMLDHLDTDLSVDTLAARVHMSPRNFARVFAREVGSTPARFVERARVEAARRQLEESRAGVDGIAAACGFGSAETMRRAFLRTLRVSPAAYRTRFQCTGPAA